jgi:hypothetical protein
VGDGFFLREFVFPLVDVGLVVDDSSGGGGGVDGGLEAEHIYGACEVVHADLFGLVLVPLVGCAGLHEDGSGVRTVAEDGDHGDKDGKDGDGEGDGLEGFAGAFIGFLEPVGELVDFSWFHGGILIAASLRMERRCVGMEGRVARDEIEDGLPVGEPGILIGLVVGESIGEKEFGGVDLLGLCGAIDAVGEADGEEFVGVTMDYEQRLSESLHDVDGSPDVWQQV